MGTVIVQIQWVQHISESDTNVYDAAVSACYSKLLSFSLLKDTDGHRLITISYLRHNHTFAHLSYCLLRSNQFKKTILKLLFFQEKKSYFLNFSLNIERCCVLFLLHHGCLLCLQDVVSKDPWH